MADYSDRISLRANVRTVGISDKWLRYLPKNGVIGNFAFWVITALELAGNRTIRKCSLSKVPNESDS